MFSPSKSSCAAIGATFGKTLASKPDALDRKREPSSIDAYHAYLRARFHRNQWTVEGFSKSIDYFLRALDYEPIMCKRSLGCRRLILFGRSWEMLPQALTSGARGKPRCERSLSARIRPKPTCRWAESTIFTIGTGKPERLNSAVQWTLIRASLKPTT